MHVFRSCLLLGLLKALLVHSCSYGKRETFYHICVWTAVYTLYLYVVGTFH